MIVDAYPFLAGVLDPKATPAKAKEMAAQMRQYMGGQTQDMYERYVKSGMSTRTMVTKESDFDRLIAWGLASDRTAVTDAMAELYQRGPARRCRQNQEPDPGVGLVDRLQGSTPIGSARRPTCRRSMPSSRACEIRSHRHCPPLHHVG